MATDIINVTESDGTIRIVSTSYEEVKPQFHEVVYISYPNKTQEAEPQNPFNGLGWLNPSTGKFKIFYSNNWVNIN